MARRQPLSIFALYPGVRLGPVIIRIAHPDDGDALAAIYRSAVVGSAISFELVPPDASEMAARVERLLVRTPWLVAADAGAVLGYAYASPHRDRPAYQWSVEVSAYVHPSAHRQGVGRALYTSLFAVLAVQGFCNAYAGVTLPNPASVGLHKAVGFTPVGVYRRVGYKDGEWHDVAWFERPLANHNSTPAQPRPFASCATEPNVLAAIQTGTTFLRRPA
jgi:L-amino acid N-acyltransferase YncA